MRALYFFALLVVAGACSTRAVILKEIKQSGKEIQNHIGFSLYDPQTKKFLIEHQSDKYFTPASNTKIFTLFAALNILGDSTVALRYLPMGDSMIIWGTGDPSFLYKHAYQTGKTYEFLQQYPGKIYFSGTNFYNYALGPGWAWSDYDSYYSAERSAFPVYGNLVEVKKAEEEFSTMPAYFMEHFTIANQQRTYEEVTRGLDDNQLTYFTGKKTRGEWTIPFRSTTDVVVDLLSDTLKREINEAPILLPAEAKSLKGTPVDSLYKVMMEDSDNFIAEQLLLQCAGVLSDSLKQEIAIKYVVEKWLSDLPDKPRWVDGSGLSRFNLFTPRSIAVLWDKIYSLVPQERLFNLLAVGGQKGTLKNSYKNDPPYIFGKTGSLNNNHVLSGYLITRKGKLLIFSLMNNNYLAPTNDVRKHMQEILYTIYTKY
ncbi:MAG TPA: D-alanyl-D-alanine carboxypeptidase [Cyclobacteriaceae bacterium]|jgi:D-alanyl-D-alanine carboxypeptidase/D-alanyl-D-alanine-endopeptidase (penicillin-binding protein 4)|nr:D-alanyl-D-alanine carboxypeptidase [Cytophagales bacterium]HNT49203.1 D-alanyl-D-alanine carboxypeptidase [Cyclobacteriaceae bacterium]